jgi:thiol:disulfide interchange protein DsbD
MLKNNLFKHLSLSFILLSFTLVSAQVNFDNEIEEPVSWEVAIEKKSNSTYELIIDADIEENWHLPSQKKLPEGKIGPSPTRIEFDTLQNNYELIGKTIEPEGVTKLDPIFNTKLTYFEDEALFKQKIKVDKNTQSLKFDIYFMICDDEKCLPEDNISYIIDFENLEVNNYSAETTQEDMAAANALSIPVDQSQVKSLSGDDEKSHVNVFFLGFLGGLIALLTPCVFPMIPLTVSFFTKGAKTRKIGIINAILYTVFIFLIYALLSLPFHLLDSVNPEFLNNISTNTILNVVFFMIFAAFAFSFFGYYEITLPSSWSSRLDEKATSLGGVIGIFLMALTLAIVSFSCTGPILGSLLGGSLSSDGGATLLSFGMSGFGLALALPFGLFALFPNWLNALPKSGGWMNTVKVVLGFIELGLAFKFLSNADLVEHWGILKREIFIGIWIVITLGLVLYLFGKIKFPHDPKKVILKPSRVIFGIVFSVFLLYLIPGLTNTSYANLKFLSGFPPPLFYSLYEKETKGPLGLKAYNSFEEGRKAAIAQDKPVLLDFTGYACVNCRKMEEQVWSKPEIYKTIKEDYVLISLYVDDKASLPQDEQFVFEKPNGGTKAINSVGDKWATFQTLNFKNNSQPYYVLLNKDYELLQAPIGFEPNANAFEEFLKAGLDNYKK